MNSCRLVLGLVFFGLAGTVHAAPNAAAQNALAQEEEAARVKWLRIQLSVETESMRIRDGGYRLISTANYLYSTGVSAAFDLKRVGQKNVLSVGVVYLRGEHDRRFAADPSHVELNSDTFYGFARLRREVGRPWLTPYVTVGMGSTMADLRLGFSDSRSEDIEANRTYFGRAALGLRLATANLILRPSMGPFPIAFSISAEVGGQIGTAAKFQLRPEIQGAAGEDAIATEGVDVGQLSRSFLFWGLKFAVQF